MKDLRTPPMSHTTGVSQSFLQILGELFFSIGESHRTKFRPLANFYVGPGVKCMLLLYDMHVDLCLFALL